MTPPSLTNEDLQEIASCIEWGLPLPARFASVFPKTKTVNHKDDHRIQELVQFGSGERGTLLAGDNLHAMDWLQSNPSKPIKLIYIDPPFDVGSDFNIPIRLPIGKAISHVAYSDTWGTGKNSFIHMLAPRLKAMIDLLDENGSIVVHCDYRTVATIRTMLDRFLGPEHFRNEIIWHYTGGGRAKKYFSRKHDSLLWYSKSDSYTFNIDAVRVPYKPTSGYARGGIVSKSGKHYRPNPKGTPVDDVWDIPIINPMAKERVGYPTQKPIALLERIINALSNEGDCVADFFCGSGTTLVVADRLNRHWVGADLSPAAITSTHFRLFDGSYRLMDLSSQSSSGVLKPLQAAQINATVHTETTDLILKVSAFQPKSLLGLSEKTFCLKSGLLHLLDGECVMNDSLDWLQGWILCEPESGQCIAHGQGRPDNIRIPNVRLKAVQLTLIDLVGGFHQRTLDVCHV